MQTLPLEHAKKTYEGETEESEDDESDEQEEAEAEAEVTTDESPSKPDEVPPSRDQPAATTTATTQKAKSSYVSKNLCDLACLYLLNI